MLRSDRASEGRSGSAASVAGPYRCFVTAAARCAPSIRHSFRRHDLDAMTAKTVTHEYADVLENLVAKRYRARAVGRVRSDGMWEGWIEFVDVAEDERLLTNIETMQSNERAFRYWAAGVGPAYLEGAFRRARSRAARGSTLFDPPLSPVHRSVLDPFEVDAQGGGLLAAQLSALDLDRLREVALAYELLPPKTVAVATRAELIVEILATVSSARRGTVSCRRRS